MEDRDAAILRIMSLGCATEPPWYKGATIIVIGKKDININNITSNINNINININMNNININNFNNIKSNINRATEYCFCLVWMFVPSPLA